MVKGCVVLLVRKETLSKMRLSYPEKKPNLDPYIWWVPYHDPHRGSAYWSLHIEKAEAMYEYEKHERAEDMRIATSSDRQDDPKNPA